MTTLDQFLRSQAVASVALRRIEVTARRQASLSFSTFGSRFTAALVGVVKNNSDMDPGDVLAREDVASLMGEALDEALTRARTAVQSAHVSSSALGSVTAQADLRRLGLEPVSASASTEYLDQVLSDLDRLVREAGERTVAEVVEAWDQPLPASVHEGGTSKNPLRDQSRARAEAVAAALERVRRAAALRAELAVATAAHRAYTDSQLAVYRAAQEAHPGTVVRKVWVASFREAGGPCPTCTFLHGVVRDLDEEFPRTGPSVYRDLQGPPRHPNCRCRLAPYLDSIATGVVSPKSLRAIERRQARPVVRMSSEAIRKMPEKRFQSIVAALTTLLSSLRRARR